MALTNKELITAKKPKNDDEMSSMTKSAVAIDDEKKAKIEKRHKKSCMPVEKSNNFVSGGGLTRPTRQVMDLAENGSVICPFCKGELHYPGYMINDGDSYDRVECCKCGKKYRLYWNGTVWTNDQ